MLEVWFIANTFLADIKYEIAGISIGFNLLVLLTSGIVWIVYKGKYSTNSLLYTFIFFGINLLFFFAALIGPCTNFHAKSLFSILIASFLFYLCLEISKNSKAFSYENLAKLSNLILLLSTIGIVFEFIYPEYFASLDGYRSEGLYTGFFSEPSHAAYSLVPLIMLLISSNNLKYIIIGLIYFCILLSYSHSSTFILLSSIGLFFIISKANIIYKFVFLLISLSFILYFINSEYFYTSNIYSRIEGVLNSDSIHNLSSMVYLQGWQDMIYNLFRTNGIGLGFNMMGCNPIPNVEMRYLIGSNSHLNSEDGSFLFSKLVSELGLLGIILSIASLTYLVVLLLKSSNPSRAPIIYTTFLLYLSFFIRSTGYFGTSFLFFILFIIFLLRK